MIFKCLLYGLNSLYILKRNVFKECPFQDSSREENVKHTAFMFAFLWFIFCQPFIFLLAKIQSRTYCMGFKKYIFCSLQLPRVGDKQWKLIWRRLKDAADSEDVSHYLLSGKCPKADTRMDFTVVSDTWICVSFGEISGIVATLQ